MFYNDVNDYKIIWCYLLLLILLYYIKTQVGIYFEFQKEVLLKILIHLLPFKVYHNDIITNSDIFCMA